MGFEKLYNTRLLRHQESTANNDINRAHSLLPSNFEFMKVVNCGSNYQLLNQSFQLRIAELPCAYGCIYNQQSGHKAEVSSAETWFLCKARLRVVPHFSSGKVERAKLERACKSPHASRLFSRGVIFKRARVSLALLSLRNNRGLLVVYFKAFCEDLRKLYLGTGW